MPRVTGRPIRTDVKSWDDVRRALQMLDAVLPAFLMFPALIRATGPNAEADYTDERYWIERAYVSNSDGDQTTAVEFAAYDAAADIGLIVTATNIAESTSIDHDLLVGTVVMVHAEYDQSAPSVIRYWFDTRPIDIPAGTDWIWLQITEQFEFPAGGREAQVGPTKWLYVGHQMEQSGTGWTEVSSAPIYAVNAIEANNVDDPNLRGNSVDGRGEDYPEGFSLQPVRGNPIVMAFPPTNGNSYWRFAYENADDGDCLAIPSPRSFHEALKHRFEVEQNVPEEFGTHMYGEPILGGL